MAMYYELYNYTKSSINWEITTPFDVPSSHLLILQVQILASFTTCKTYYGLHSLQELSALLGLDPLQIIRKDKRITLFHTALDYESIFSKFLSTIDQIKANHDFNTNHFSTFDSFVYNTNKFLKSFLIWTVCDLYIGENAVDPFHRQWGLGIRQDNTYVINVCNGNKRGKPFNLMRY